MVLTIKEKAALALEKALYASWARSWFEYVKAESFRESFDETLADAQRRYELAAHEAEQLLTEILAALAPEPWGGPEE